ncbi:hypothetical protein [Pseudolysinimonas kribbensis]|uniref:hypothetical protein n=1 Tax=Pseudolysinimonas kribbensis TaxID=433641 RepID=UPI0024E08A08|nr:hypothetical protein [Pseudolysinimonas kribbensis]
MNEGNNFDSPVYRRPAYSSSEPQLTGDDDDMSVLYLTTSASTDGVIPSGWAFLDSGIGPIRPLTAYQRHNLLWFGGYDDNGNAGGGAPTGSQVPLRLAAVPGNTIRQLAQSVGCAEWAGTPPTLVVTGRVFYGSETPFYPKVSIG